MLFTYILVQTLIRMVLVGVCVREREREREREIERQCLSERESKRNQCMLLLP